MEKTKLREELIELLTEKGAKLVGIGTLDGIEAQNESSDAARALREMRTGIAVAVPLPAHIVEDLKTAPTLEYYHAYHTLNAKLNDIVSCGETFLKQCGYQAYAQTTDRVSRAINPETNISPLPHKTIAARAGLGWIGKSCLLVTPQYGGAVRISSLLTDASLETDKSFTKSECGECRRCVDACPAGALAGMLWEAGMERERLFDWQLCLPEQLRRMRDATGIEQDLCGRCFAVCPYTQKYLQSCR